MYEILQQTDLLLKLELLLRLLISVFCGYFIGHERTNQGKHAGVRTHSIVAIASCLMMIVSQYGFADFFRTVMYPNVDMRLDPSRVAAQIISGIGFLGAGMIYVHKNTVTGLTTAAGIWATAGIGMAIGGGMYFIGITCTAVIVIIQLLMHRNSRLFHFQMEDVLVFTVEDSPENIAFLLDLLSEHEITVQKISYDRVDGKLLKITINAQYNDKDKLSSLITKVHEVDAIKSAQV